MLEEYLLDIGYKEKQIQLLKNNYYLKREAPHTLIFSFKTLLQYLSKNGFSNQDFIDVTIKNPNLLGVSIENIKNRVQEVISLGFQKNQVFELIKGYPYLLEITKRTLQSRVKNLAKMGFSKEQITSLPILLSYDHSSFQKLFQNFVHVGYSKKETICLFAKDSSFIDYSEKELLKKVRKLKELGYDEESVYAISSLYPKLLVDENYLYQFFSPLLDKSFSIQDIIEITKKVPSILEEEYQDYIENGFEPYESFQFRTEEYHSIIMKHPYLLLYPNDYIKDRLLLLQDFNFSIDNIKKIILQEPIILSYHKKTLSNRLSFFEKEGIKDLVFSSLMGLIYSEDFLKKRMIYLKKNHGNLEDVLLDEEVFKRKHQSSWDLWERKEDYDEFLH